MTCASYCCTKLTLPLMMTLFQGQIIFIKQTKDGISTSCSGHCETVTLKCVTTYVPTCLLQHQWDFIETSTRWAELYPGDALLLEDGIFKTFISVYSDIGMHYTWRNDRFCHEYWYGTWLDGESLKNCMLPLGNENWTTEESVLSSDN